MSLVHTFCMRSLNCSIRVRTSLFSLPDADPASPEVTNSLHARVAPVLSAALVGFDRLLDLPPSFGDARPPATVQADEKRQSFLIGSHRMSVVLYAFRI
jgi:hypothetical protein